MKKVPLLLSLVATVLSLASCEKEQLEKAGAPAEAATASSLEAKTSLLTTGDWKLISKTAVLGQAETDLLVMQKAAQRDDLSKFRAAGLFLQDEGATKRDEQAPQQQEGTWEFRANGDSLTVTSAGITRRYAVAELSISRLRLTRTVASADSKAETLYTAVYSH